MFRSPLATIIIITVTLACMVTLAVPLTSQYLKSGCYVLGIGTTESDIIIHKIRDSAHFNYDATSYSGHTATRCQVLTYIGSYSSYVHAHV